MSLLVLLGALVVIGVLLYFLNQIPMDAAFKTLIRVVAIVVAIWIILEAFGIIDYLRGVHTPKL